ncbi:MAG: exodeoxyribonuclease V subunit gamma, partial [Rhodanobacter sp.]
MTAGSASGQLRRVDAASRSHGLVIYRASRLEALLPPLRELLAATAPQHVLAPHTLIAAHPGMRQWLTGALAREYGADGIAANLDVQLPSSWIDRLAQQQLGQQAVALPGYQRQHLRWTLHAALDGGVHVPGVTDARIAAYVESHPDADRGTAAETARRRFQLADRLAGVFSQYLVYRPDWLRAWEQGRFHAATRGSTDAVALSTEQQLLGPLWRHLRARLGPHRGDIVADLILRLGRDEPSPDAVEAVHVFGVSHLAPSELAVLRAYAQRHLVALYVPDPCREYWGGLARELPVLRAQRRDELARIEQAAGNDYWVEQTHPLLANWGRLGQHFIMALADGDGDVLEDVRHWRDTQPEPACDRLSRVQQSVRQLQPQLMAVDLRDGKVASAERADASLCIHSCHTRLRELEVLRDQLLETLATPGPDDSSVKPSDILVMAPDIQAYVPLIPAVFGVPGDARERLPYHLADVAVARSHGLFTAFRRWLDLPGTRVTAPEIVDLLAIPEVARRLNVDAGGLQELTQWLRESRVAWALDGNFRERFGVPPIPEHTFGWAMERMLVGYLMADGAAADRQPGVTLPDGSVLAPLTSIHGPAAGNLGALEQLLREVQSLCDLAGKTLPASAWASALERRFESLFRIDPTDRAARDAQTLLLRFIRGIASEPAAAGEDPLLHFAVVRDLLVARLAAAPEHQRFLLGGITFCGMVPQRAIPFKVVAVLGLNDGEFPRAASDGGLDLMTRFRRLGDRDVRTDDRY